MDNLLQMNESFPAPEQVKKNAYLQDYEAEYKRSVEDPEGFWGGVAEELSWFKPWDQVRKWECPNHEWFVGGQVNITYNALDRHLTTGKRNKVAFHFLGEDGSERQVTYGQLHTEVSRAASALKKLGVEKGDRVVIYMPLSIEGCVAMLACARIGAIHSVVYAGLGAGALRERIHDSQAKVVFTTDCTYRRGKAVPLKPIVDEAVVGLDEVKHIVVWQRETQKELKGREVDFNAFMASGVKNFPAEVMESEDPLFILYTSGTTAKPKGVVHVHGGYMVGTYYMCKNFMDLKEDDVYWCTSDIGWIVGHSYIVYAPLVAGITTIIREGALDYPTPEQTWKIIDDYNVTVLFTAPTALRMLMKFGDDGPKKYDLTTLRLILCAGEPLNPEAWRWANDILVGPHGGYIVDNWWQTEIAGPTLGTLPIMDSRPGKVGKPMPGVVADVVDDKGNSVGPNKGGLLVLRTPFPHMLRTVFGNQARYEQYWTEIVPGCYATGDTAMMDEDGYFVVLGRADDVLNIAGHRIGTMEVESALVSHPAVAEAAAISKPDPVKGEVLKTFVILRLGNEGSDALRKELVQHVRKVMGPIVVISELDFVPKLPKTRSGKIIRRLLKAIEMGQDPGDLTTLEE